MRKIRTFLLFSIVSVNCFAQTDLDLQGIFIASFYSSYNSKIERFNYLEQFENLGWTERKNHGGGGGGACGGERTRLLVKDQDFLEFKKYTGCIASSFYKKQEQIPSELITVGNIEFTVQHLPKDNNSFFIYIKSNDPHSSQTYFFMFSSSTMTIEEISKLIFNGFISRLEYIQSKVEKFNESYLPKIEIILRYYRNLNDETMLPVLYKIWHQKSNYDTFYSWYHDVYRVNIHQFRPTEKENVFEIDMTIEWDDFSNSSYKVTMTVDNHKILASHSVPLKIN